MISFIFQLFCVITIQRRTNGLMADDFFHRKTTNGIVYAVFPGEQLQGYLFLCFGNHLPDPSPPQLQAAFLGALWLSSTSGLSSECSCQAVFPGAEIDSELARGNYDSVLLSPCTLHFQRCHQCHHQPAPLRLLQLPASLWTRLQIPPV